MHYPLCHAGPQDEDSAVIVYTEARVGERAKERVSKERDIRRYPREVCVERG